MIQIVHGDIFNAGTDAIVNTVNTQGVMGRGLAAQFKVIYPEMFEDYKQACEKGEVRVGKMHVYRISNVKPYYIINFPTKEDWHEPSKVEYIEKGLNALCMTILTRDISSIAIPALGCGLGELSWSRVLTLIVNRMEIFLQEYGRNIDILIYEPLEAS
jgi:O-acetyl-ADP-ribose deacetylase (regulator of RNase III)